MMYMMYKMKKWSMPIMAFIFISAFILLLSGCKKEPKSSDINNDTNEDTNDVFDIKDFENAMKEKGYQFEIIDVDKDFLPTTRKRLVNDNMAIDIYVFDSEEEMEEEAGYIDYGGTSYNNGKKALHVSWVSHPHFYKKGCLIVQYVGEDTNILKDLEDIMGKQFAGFSQY